MSTKSLGSNGTTTLTALQFPSFSATSFSDADIATMVALILNDQIPSLQQVGAWSRMGLLYVPNRGVLKTLPGDWVAVSPNDGWPILVSPIACPTTLTLTVANTSGSAVLTATTSALTAGWQIGAQVTGTGIATNSVISNISANGLSITLSKVCTSSNASLTATCGNYTHS